MEPVNIKLRQETYDQLSNVFSMATISSGRKIDVNICGRTYTVEDVTEGPAKVNFEKLDQSPDGRE